MNNAVIVGIFLCRISRYAQYGYKIIKYNPRQAAIYNIPLLEVLLSSWIDNFSNFFVPNPTPVKGCSYAIIKHDKLSLIRIPLEVFSSTS